LLELAFEFGWKPEGTRDPRYGVFDLDPSPDTVDREWDGDYFTNSFQLVSDSDARSLGQALLRAADDIRKRRPDAPAIPVIVELGNFAVAGAFRIW